MDPAAPLTAAPVLMRTSPDRPSLLSPVPVIRVPDAPDAVVPVNSVMLPLEPADTASADRIDTAPLEDEPPAPDETVTEPPRANRSVVRPDDSTNAPPIPDVELPTTMLTPPARPLDDRPV